MTEKRGALIRLADVCEILGISEKAVEQMGDAGTIKRIRLYKKGRWFYYRKEVEAVANGEKHHVQEAK